jgi:GAF domain-containing protein
VLVEGQEEEKEEKEVAVLLVVEVVSEQQETGGLGWGNHKSRSFTARRRQMMM